MLNYGKRNIMSKSSKELTKDEIVIEFVSEDDLQDSDYIDEYLNKDIILFSEGGIKVLILSAYKKFVNNTKTKPIGSKFKFKDS